MTATAPGKGDDLALVALGDGALIGRRIVVDAASGGADTTRHAAPDTTAAADSLTRVHVFEADANLRVARALAADLRAAGAVVLLTRDTADSLSAIDRLRASEGFGADRVVTISHRAAPGTALAGHYFASAAGKALAQRVAAQLESRGLVRTAPVAATPGYLVQQTGLDRGVGRPARRGRALRRRDARRGAVSTRRRTRSTWRSSRTRVPTLRASSRSR